MNETNCCTREPMTVLLLLFLSAGHTLPPDMHKHTCTHSPPPNTHADWRAHTLGERLSSWHRPTMCCRLHLSACLSASSSPPLPVPRHLSTVPCAPSAFFILGKRPSQSLGRLKVYLGRHLGPLRMASCCPRRARGAWQGCHQMLQPLEPACQVLGVLVGGTRGCSGGC